MKKFALLFLSVVLLISAAGCGEKYDIDYHVNNDIREYPVDGEMCAGYKVSIDIDTFDTSSKQAFNKQIKYLFDEVIKDDGYYQHTVWVYDNILQTDGTFTVAMVEDDKDWAAGWGITSNEDFYNELFE